MHIEDPFGWREKKFHSLTASKFKLYKCRLRRDYIRCVEEDTPPSSGDVDQLATK